VEQFDILDISGNPVGLVANKGALLREGQYYLGVHAYIYNSKNEFLLQQRAMNKEFLPGGWDIHMGHVVAGETPKAGMIREIREEIGLRFDDGDLHFIGKVVWEPYHHMIDIFFLHTDFDINKLTLQQEEVIGVKSISLDDMLIFVANMTYRPLEYRELVSNKIKIISGIA
jgi:8-oxo-dGTP pyrophosphatase MutT (NUDIX family)